MRLLGVGSGATGGAIVADVVLALLELRVDAGEEAVDEDGPKEGTKDGALRDTEFEEISLRERVAEANLEGAIGEELVDHWGVSDIAADRDVFVDRFLDHETTEGVGEVDAGAERAEGLGRASAIDAREHRIKHFVGVERPAVLILESILDGGDVGVDGILSGHTFDEAKLAGVEAGDNHVLQTFEEDVFPETAHDRGDGDGAVGFQENRVGVFLEEWRED